MTTTAGGYVAYVWGGNDDTGRDNEPVRAEALDCVQVQQIACALGEDAGALVLTTDGKLRQWGPPLDWLSVDHAARGIASSSLFLFANNNNNNNAASSSLTNNNNNVVTQIASGFWHHAAVCSNGHLYTWGKGSLGKLGHGNKDSFYSPVRVQALPGISIKSVACAAEHTVALTTTGAVYTWGSNEFGMTGHGVFEGTQLLPRLVEKLQNEEASKVSACNVHTAVVTQRGSVYTWGCGEDGKLGHGNEDDQWLPRLVGALQGQEVVQAACGFWHTAVVTKTGKLYTFGGNQFGQLGVDDQEKRLEPTLVQPVGEGLAYSQVACGRLHSVAVTTEGRVYTWGSGKRGQLGHGSCKRILKPERVRRLESYRAVHIAAFQNVTLALMDPSSLAPDDIPITICYRNMVNNEECADVVFLVDNERVFGHRAILIQRCDFFRSMFRSGMRESQEREITIPSIGKVAFLRLLEYLYVGTVAVDVDDAVELCMAAEMYGLKGLRCLCCKSVKDNLRIENAARLLQVASHSSCQVIEELCMVFVVENLREVSKSEGIKQLSQPMLLDIMGQYFS